MTLCIYCNQPITFDSLHTTPSGKQFPLDIDTKEPHDCDLKPVKRRKCHNCSESIFLDPSIRNPSNGKLIPQDDFGNHKCLPRIEKFNR